MFLPPYMFKRIIYSTFIEKCEEEGSLPPSFRTFCVWWSQEPVHVRLYPTEKRMCATCVNVQHRLRGLAPEDVAIELEELQRHIEMEAYGREYYRKTQDEAQKYWQRRVRVGERLISRTNLLILRMQSNISTDCMRGWTDMSCPTSNARV